MLSGFSRTSGCSELELTNRTVYFFPFLIRNRVKSIHNPIPANTQPGETEGFIATNGLPAHGTSIALLLIAGNKAQNEANVF
jgi:hypothetical protein